MRNSDEIWGLVDRHRESFEALSDRIFDMPEIAYNEHRSVAEHIASLREHGFRVTENLAGINTAVMGEAGEGGPVIAILGEYDPLPGLSQEAGATTHTPLAGAGIGHRSAHNLLASPALLAATAVNDRLARHN